MAAPSEPTLRPPLLLQRRASVRRSGRPIVARGGRGIVALAAAAAALSSCVAADEEEKVCLPPYCDDLVGDYEVSLLQTDFEVTRALAAEGLTAAGPHPSSTSPFELDIGADVGQEAAPVPVAPARAAADASPLHRVVEASRSVEDGAIATKPSEDDRRLFQAAHAAGAAPGRMDAQPPPMPVFSQKPCDGVASLFGRGCWSAMLGSGGAQRSVVADVIRWLAVFSLLAMVLCWFWITRMPCSKVAIAQKVDSLIWGEESRVADAERRAAEGVLAMASAAGQASCGSEGGSCDPVVSGAAEAFPKAAAIFAAPAMDAFGLSAAETAES